MTLNQASEIERDMHTAMIASAVSYIRHNGELTVEEKALMNPKPRSDKEMKNIMTSPDRFEDLYDVLDDELSYFNCTFGTSITKEQFMDAVFNSKPLP